MIYPPSCPGCKKQVDEQGAWCTACLAQILAPRTIYGSRHGLIFLDSCQVICEYTGVLKRIIHDMKFRHQKKYGGYLRWLLQYNPSESECIPWSVVIPVPLHKERLQERGYNQTEAIFKKWAQEMDMEWMPDALLRNRYTIPQWELNLHERKGNMKDAFMVVESERIKKRNILLVDDIITTGITLDECAKELKKAGASRVQALVIASGAR